MLNYKQNYLFILRKVQQKRPRMISKPFHNEVDQRLRNHPVPTKSIWC